MKSKVLRKFKYDYETVPSDISKIDTVIRITDGRCHDCTFSNLSVLVMRYLFGLAENVAENDSDEVTLEFNIHEFLKYAFKKKPISYDDMIDVLCELRYIYIDSPAIFWRILRTENLFSGDYVTVHISGYAMLYRNEIIKTMSDFLDDDYAIGED